jgi:hypothetical protein
MTPFQPKLRITQKVNAVFDEVKQLQRGDLLPYPRIEALTGLTRADDQWKYIILRVRKLTLERLRIDLFCERNEGYKLLTAGEHVTVAAPSYRHRAYNQHKKEHKTLVAVAEERLPEPEQQARDLGILRARRMLALIRKTGRETSAILRANAAVG